MFEDEADEVHNFPEAPHTQFTAPPKKMSGTGSAATDKASAAIFDLDTLLSNPIIFVPAKFMADPFEVRMRFTAQLQHLNASVTSSQKAAQYAIKYKDMDEDLHSCILEQLEKVSFAGFVMVEQEHKFDTDE